MKLKELSDGDLTVSQADSIQAFADEANALLAKKNIDLAFSVFGGVNNLKITCSTEADPENCRIVVSDARSQKEAIMAIMKALAHYMMYSPVIKHAESCCK